MNGFPMPTSGVTVIGRNPFPSPVVESIDDVKSAAKLGSKGLEKFGGLKMLNTSARSCSRNLSVIAVSLKIEKSTL